MPDNQNELRSNIQRFLLRGPPVGVAQRGKHIYVLLDPVDREWVFTTAAGVQLRRKVAEEITRERIMKLQVTDRR